jgi:hypothetical protein
VRVARKKLYISGQKDMGIITVPLLVVHSVLGTSAIKRRANYLPNIGHVGNCGQDLKEVKLLVRPEESANIEQILVLGT